MRMRSFRTDIHPADVAGQVDPSAGLGSVVCHDFHVHVH